MGQSADDRSRRISNQSHLTIFVPHLSSYNTLTRIILLLRKIVVTMSLVKAFLSRGGRSSWKRSLSMCFATALQPLVEETTAGMGPVTITSCDRKAIHSSRGYLKDATHVEPKAVLRSLLAEGPRTSDELWEQAERHGFKSKRFMKTMLKQMRQRGEILTKPPQEASGNHTHHGSLSFVYHSTAVLRQPDN